jgi:hypothetical protein
MFQGCKDPTKYGLYVNTDKPLSTEFEDLGTTATFTKGID